MDANLFYEKDNVIPESLCNEIIRLFEEDDNKEDGKVDIANDTPDIILKNLKQSIELGITNGGNKWLEIDKLLQNIIEENEIEYIDSIGKNLKSRGMDNVVQGMIFESVFNEMYDIGYTISRIDKGMRYEWHEDSGGISSGSLFGCIIYLNTLHDHEGGMTEFINGKTVQPKVGKILFFPTTWSNFHRGCEVKGRSKYIITTTIRRKS